MRRSIKPRSDDTSKIKRASRSRRCHNQESSLPQSGVDAIRSIPNAVCVDQRESYVDGTDPNKQAMERPSRKQLLERTYSNPCEGSGDHVLPPDITRSRRGASSRGGRGGEVGASKERDDGGATAGKGLAPIPEPPTWCGWTVRFSETDCSEWWGARAGNAVLRLGATRERGPGDEEERVAGLPDRERTRRDW